MEGKKIKVHTDKRGKEHIDIYTKDPKGKHNSIHINWDSNTGKGNIVDTTNEPKETTDISCYLTTACMKYLRENFDDNCYELTVLRWFRDNFVSKENIEHYYEVTPIIVEIINKEENPDIVYNYIYDNVVNYCVEQIEQENYDKAYSRYKYSILALEEQYIKILPQQNLVKTLKK